MPAFVQQHVDKMMSAKRETSAAPDTSAGDEALRQEVTKTVGARLACLDQAAVIWARRVRDRAGNPIATAVR